jgi:hypothetical protein
MSEHFAEKARAAGDDARYVALEGVDHRALIDPRSAAWGEISASLEALFRA